MKFNDYQTDVFYDEISEESGLLREESHASTQRMESLLAGDLQQSQQTAFAGGIERS